MSEDNVAPQGRPQFEAYFLNKIKTTLVEFNKVATLQKNGIELSAALSKDKPVEYEDGTNWGTSWYSEWGTIAIHASTKQSTPVEVSSYLARSVDGGSHLHAKHAKVHSGYGEFRLTDTESFSKFITGLVGSAKIVLKGDFAIAGKDAHDLDWELDETQKSVIENFRHDLVMSEIVAKLKKEFPGKSLKGIVRGPLLDYARAQETAPSPQIPF